MGPRTLAAVCIAGLLLSLSSSISSGAGSYNLFDFIAYFWSGAADSPNQELVDVLVRSRLPRTLAAVVVGGGLAIAATLLQTVTRNPLAEPGLVGVNAGAVLGITIGMSYFSAAGSRAFLLWAGGGALAASALVLGVAALSRRASPPHLILIGIAASATLGGVANYVLMSFATTLERFRFWNLGSLAGVDLTSLRELAPFAALIALGAFGLARPLTVMQLGDDHARTLGVPVAAVTFGVWIAAAGLTAVAVALAGPIMFAGFLAAYCAKLLVGPRLAPGILLSAAFGMILLLVADVVARSAIQPYEVPVGVVVALLGTPLTVAAARSRAFRAALVRHA